MRIKFIASVAAALSLAFLPTAAQAVETTLDVQNGGSAAVDVADGDSLDVTVAGPIAKTGPAVHELYSTWSAQSLALYVTNASHPENYITWPEGWDLEYTEDGTTWVNWATTTPTDIGAIIAIRALGDVNTVGENIFKTTTIGALYATQFNGSGDGDGFDVAVGSDRVYNVWHHQENTISVDCHYFSGEWCETATFAIPGYSNNNNSRAFYDDATDRLYTYVMYDTDSTYGVLCVDYSDPANVSTCGYTPLNDSVMAWDRDDYGTQSLDGTKIWSVQGSSGLLMCFDIATEAACSDNDADTGESTNNAKFTGRVTAVGGKVYWTLGDKMGCYDPTTDGACNGSTPITLTDTENRHAPFPVENTSGTILGVCDLYTRQCIDTDGATMTVPAALDTFWDNNVPNHDVAAEGYEQFAYGDNRFYYEVDLSTGWGSNSVVCYDFQTEAACAGFDGEAIEGLDDFYSATLDSSTPGCLWINQDSGLIIPINAETGVKDCDLGDPIVELPYDAATPRMSCAEEGRVIEWNNLTISVPAGVAMSDVVVSIYDSNGDIVPDWDALVPNASGVIDLSGLTVGDTGTQPTIRIASGDVSNSLAEQITGTVQFVAEDPELCFTLAAADNCTSTITNSPAAGDIADGIVTGTSITRPTAGNDVGSAQTTTLPGQNADQMCAASALEIDLPIAALASTGVDAGAIAMGGFAVLAAGGAAVAVTRRRKA